MSQALYTSMSGINAATTQISVVSNNVANINTTAFKSADARFENLFSKTYTTGNSPTKTAGGINPMQIGMGVEVGSIVRNFTEGTYVSTGRTEDLMISGGGYFTVMNANGEIFYTRDGSFTLDAEGHMVTQSGMYVLGAAQVYNTSASQTKINVPQTIKTTTTGNTALGSSIVGSLNDASITPGTFTLKFANDKDPQYVQIEIKQSDLAGSVDNLINNINTQIVNAGITAVDKDGNTVAGIVAKTTDPSDGTIYFQAQPQYTKTVALQETGLINDTEATLYKMNLGSVTVTDEDGNNPKTYDLSNCYWSGNSGNPQLYTLSNGKFTLIEGVTVNTSQTVGVNPGVELQVTSVLAVDGTGVARTANITNGYNATKNTEPWPTISFTAGTSNFLEQTKLATAAQTEDGRYVSKTLDYTVKIEPIAALSEAVNLKSYSVGTDGTIEATYSNGDHITVEANKQDNTFEWKYTTSNGVVIRGADKIDMNPNIADTSGFVLQLATVTNEAGLVSQNNNLWSIGPNTGDTVYAVGGSMGLGEIHTGGLEGSNVDLSRELSNMILAQRAIQANSRVFSTASTVMESLTYLGS